MIPAHWFRRHRAIAVGIVVAGSSVGGIVFPIMLSQLFARIGFAWAVRAMALLLFVVQAVSIPFVRERLPPQAKTADKGWEFLDMEALKDARFVLHAGAAFFIAFGACFNAFLVFWFGMREM